MLQRYENIGEEVMEDHSLGEVDESDMLYQVILKPYLYHQLNKDSNDTLIKNYSAIIEKNSPESIRIRLLNYFHNTMLKKDQYFKTSDKKIIFQRKYMAANEILQPPLSYATQKEDLLYRLLKITSIAARGG